MAKKKTIRKAVKKAPAKPALAIESTEDLHADAANPRAISDEGAAGLRASLKRFGDLSGIVWNKRTGELVCGHQRMSQIRDEYGDHDIEVVDAEAGLGVIRVDADHVFPVRVVDWSAGKQRTANVAANNQKTQGKFTDALSTYLLEVQGDVQEELGGAWDELLLVDLIDLNEITPMDGLGEHEDSDTDMSTIKFAFPDAKSRQSVEHAVEKCKSSEGFDKPAIDGQAIAHICKIYLAQ